MIFGVIPAVLVKKKMVIMGFYIGEFIRVTGWMGISG